MSKCLQVMFAKYDELRYTF